ncbi:MAG: two-component regulator propeller domain-containing protein [Bacteroidota bacterium]
MREIVKGIQVFVGLLLCCLNGWGQTTAVQFQQLSPGEGLSQGTIFSIAQDRWGFMWFGTADGLNRFDGYSFTNYYFDRQDSASLSSNHITTLATTYDGSLWVGTKNGLCKYNPEYNNFVRVHEHIKLPSNRITALAATPDSTLWIGTEEGLVNISLDLKESHTFNQAPYLPNNHITALAWGSYESLWIGTQSGLVKMYSTEGGGQKFETIHHPAFSGLPIRAIAPSPYEALYVGTDYGLWEGDQQPTTGPMEVTAWSTEAVISLGFDPHHNHVWAGHNHHLARYSIHSGKAPEKFNSNQLARNSLSDNTIMSMYQSQEGIWWFGASSGLNFFDPASIKFGNYSLTENGALDLVNNRVWRVLAHPEGGYWLGTEGGLVRVTPEMELIRYQAEPGTEGALQDNRVRSLIYGPSGNLWVGTEYGLHQLDPATGDFTHYLFEDEQPGVKGIGNQIQTMYWQSPTQLWCGTDRGIYILNPETEAITKIRAQPELADRLQNDNIVFLYEDGLGNLWVGTAGGLHRWTGVDEVFEVFRHDPTDANSLVSDELRSILHDSQGRLWLGTRNGLDLMLSDGTFKHYDERHNLPNHVIYSILEDERERLWVSTNRGISVFTIPQEIFRNFGIMDGLQGNEFNTQSADKTIDGLLIFGGINGFNTFYPDSLTFNEFRPPTFITQIDLDGKQLNIGSQLLPKAPLVLDTIWLNHDQNFLTVHFTGLSYTNTQKNTYQYRLLGLRDGWINLGTQRFASLTNLPGGTYTLEVRTTNNDNLRSEQPARLVLNIQPPFYQTTWFRVLLAIILLIIAIAIFQQRIQSIQHQKERLEKTVEERTTQIQRQASSLEQQALELKRNYEDTKVMADIGREITSHMNGNELVHFLFKRLSGFMDLHALIVGLNNPDRNRLELMGMKRPNQFIPFHWHNLDDTHFPGVYALVNEQPLFFRSYTEDYARIIGSTIPPSFTTDMPQSVIYVPFYKEDQVIGVVSVHSLKQNAYTEFEFDIIRNLAAYIAIATDNARAYFQIQEQKEEIEQMNESLEMKVRERTHQLEIQKNKLEEFAQINAHKVRRPLAAMMGLVPLLRWAKKREEHDNLLESLEVSSKELDGMVHRMNKILTEQGILSAEEIAKDRKSNSNK